MSADSAQFEHIVIAYALNELSLPELQRWAYEHSDEVLSAAGLDTQIALLEADFSSDKSVVAALNPWFRKRFANTFNDVDLRGLRGSHMTGRFKDYVRRSLT